MTLPIQYWYKTGAGGYAAFENELGLLYEQKSEEHVFNIGLALNLATLSMISDNFEYKLHNAYYFTTAYHDSNEYFFHTVLNNTFVFYNVPFLGSYVTMESLELFSDLGFGLARNMRYEEYIKNPITNQITRSSSKERYDSLNVLYGAFGLNLNFTPHMTLGFMIETPKFNLDPQSPIGNQNTYTTIKIWSELKL